MPVRRIRITGVVQGVFFRARAKEAAEALGVTGWVRNCDDGSVEIHVEGQEEALRQLEEWCHKGPTGARVEGVDVEESEAEGCDRFEIKD